MLKIVLWLLAGVVVLAGATYVAFQVSPWPGALLIRSAFEKDTQRIVGILDRHVPDGVSAKRDVRYAEGDPDALLDIYYPTSLEGTARTLPTVVWTHGGAWISGNKDQIGGYLKILAARGYTTVSVGYSIAPGARYPTPIRQLDAALAYLKENGAALHVDASRMVLAGDSAGAQIAAQMANIISDPAYAEEVGIAPSIERERLAGTLLFCGAYDIDAADFNGAFAGFLKTVLWSYSGRKDFLDDPAFDSASVARYVTGAFPPSFISAGNGDPLGPQSVLMAKALEDRGVRVDALFFPADTTPALPHEYQFDLDTDAAQQALERVVDFLGGVMPRD